jgi:hypothetical protein
MKIEVIGTDETVEFLEIKLREIPETLDNLLAEEVYSLEAEIVRTSPVRTGRYRNAWRTIRRKLDYIVYNDVKYAKFLIFGTSKMPVKHNVRGIIHSWKLRLKTRLSFLFR